MTVIAQLRAPTTSGCKVWVWSDASGIVSLSVGGQTFSATLDTGVNSGTVVLNINNLSPGEKAGRVDVLLDGVAVDYVFPRALPEKNTKVLWAGCLGSYETGMIFSRMIKEDADLFSWGGDIIYSCNFDGRTVYGFTPETAHTTGSVDGDRPQVTTENFQQMYLLVFSKPYIREFMRRTPTVFMWDDHELPGSDYVGDAFSLNDDATGTEVSPRICRREGFNGASAADEANDIAAIMAICKTAFIDNCSSGNWDAPEGTGDTDPLYSSVGNDVAKLILIDCIEHKTPNLGVPSGASNRIIGDNQRGWLKGELDNSKPNHLIFSSKKTIPSQIDSGDGWSNYLYEREDPVEGVLTWIDSNATGVSWYCADRHQPSYYNLQSENGDAYDHNMFVACDLGYANHALGVGYADGEVWKRTGNASTRGVDEAFYGRVDITASGIEVYIIEMAKGVVAGPAVINSSDNYITYPEIRVSM